MAQNHSGRKRSVSMPLTSTRILWAGSPSVSTQFLPTASETASTTGALDAMPW